MLLSKELELLAAWHDGQGHDQTAKMVRKCIPVLEKHEAEKARSAKAKPKK